MSPAQRRDSMEMLDLRQVQSRFLESLFQEEVCRWREDLLWDYRPSIELIRKFIDAHSLSGCVALEKGEPAGYGFYVLDDRKALIGGMFVASRFDHAEVTQRLIGEIIDTLHATPRLQRIETQLMPFGAELDPVFLSRYFRLHPRQFMVLPLASARLSGTPLSSGLRLEPWNDRAFEAAARMIHLTYVGHVDADINDQYRSEAGGLKFLRNIVLLPGCGQFLPEASFLAQPVIADAPVGMVLTSSVADGVAHTTQVCVVPGHQGHSVGRHMMEASIEVLRRKGYESLSLTVTSVNRRAVELYEHLGFRTVKSFAAGVWEA